MQAKWRSEIPLLLIVAATFVTAVVAWQFAPNSLPVHWNFRGEVDRYGGKFEGLLLMPLIGAGIYLLLLVLPHFDPGRANYESFRSSYQTIRVSVQLLMAGIYVCILLSTFGHGDNLGLFVPIAVGILFIVLGNVMGKIRPNWFVGVRTPWTLSSRQSWNKTHRLAGRLFVAMGIAIGACGFFLNPFMIGVVVTLIVSSVIWMIVYSYLIWRDDPERMSPAATSPANHETDLE